MKAKTTYCILLTIMINCSLTLISSCGGDSDSPSKSAEVTAILTSATWKIHSVTVDGTDQTDLYENLTLNFSSKRYTSTNGQPVWPASGTWTFGNEDASILIRSDGVEVTIHEATNTSLKLGLTWNETTMGQGRGSSLSGDHLFSFVK